MVKQGTGLALIFMGGMGAESEYLILPILLILIGAYLVLHDN